MGMNREDAESYLRRKTVPATENNVAEVMKRGKIYGDPIAMCE